MLMVIFGAGASCDSCSSFPPKKEPRGWQDYRPPLAKELFLPTEFRRLPRRYDRFQALLPTWRIRKTSKKS